MTLDRIVRSLTFLAFLLSVLAVPALAQSGSVDLTFNSVPSNPPPNDITFQHVIQPDGKIIVYGAPSMFVNGVLRGSMFRLNPDGTNDTTFSYNNEGGVGITNVLVAPDGKIVVAGSASPNHAKMIRLNSDGSLDNSFSVFISAVGPPEFTGNWLSVNAVQADGKVIATHGSWGNIGGTWYSYSMRRYNVDGSVDSSFTAPSLAGGHLVTTSPLIELLPDGRFYLAISTGNHLGRSMSLTRRLADGAIDPTFPEYTQSIGGGFFINFSDIDATADGGLLASGLFWPSMVGGPYQRNLHRFLPTGGIDPAFSSPPVYVGDRVNSLPDGKVLYSATATSGAAVKMMRLNSDGSIDNTYVMDPVVTSIKNPWQADPQNRPVFLATTANGPRFVRLLENGAIDPSFAPVIGSPGTGRIVATQPDGKVIIGGSFAAINGTPRSNFARLNADGTLDTTFDPGTGFNTLPLHLLVLPDGKILAMGTFSTYNGASVSKIIRLNANGSLDGSFSTSITGSGVFTGAIQADGKIVIGGFFSAVNGSSRTGVARLDSNGALDETFNPVLALNSGGVTGLVAEPDGKITLVGRFTTVTGLSRINLVRVDSTGATDPTFDGGGVPDSNRVFRQPDGKYLFLSGNGGNQSVNRRNSNGTPDNSFVGPIFSTPSGSINLESLLLRPDGSMLVGGSFSLVRGVPRSNLVRLGPYGDVDPLFLPAGTNGTVYSMAASGPDKALIAGNFTSVANTSRIGVARINVPDIAGTPFDFNGDGRADYTVYRPSTGVWYQLFSNGDPYASPTFGLAGDIPVPADFDGDGKTDIAIWRPSNGDWWYKSSINGVQFNAHFGQAGDVPLPGDYDGDGKADFIVYRPGTGTWYRMSTATPQQQFSFGQTGDQPVVGDFDGDGKTDMAIFRPSSGDWWYAASSASFAHRSVHWGATGDIPAPADYDGDGKTDFAVFRPSNGGWYVYRSSDQGYTIVGFGLNGDRPIPADYDGDGRADIAVFRPSNGVWYLMQSTAGIGGVQWGIATDVAIPNAFLP